MAGSRRRTWIIVLIVVVAAAAGVAAWLLLSGGGVTVPDVTGKSQADATQLLEGAGLTVGKVTPAADQNAAAGTVTAQDPAAGVKVDDGSAVALTVSSGPGTTAVPDVTGLAVGDAQDTLKSAGFEPITTFQYDAQTPENEVMAQLPGGGDQAYTGSSVGLLVSRGQPDRVDVPDVTGMSQQDATAALADVGSAGRAGRCRTTTRRPRAPSPPRIRLRAPRSRRSPRCSSRCRSARAPRP